MLCLKHYWKLRVTLSYRLSRKGDLTRQFGPRRRDILQSTEVLTTLSLTLPEHPNTPADVVAYGKRKTNGGICSNHNM
jgi:hypothetical protein